MIKQLFDEAAQYISPIEINGLKGRVLSLPSKKILKDSAKQKEILFIYGHHPSLERYYPFAADVCKYGNVTMPDLPGFGGMDSFYKIKLKPDLDRYADYLATFIKLRYRGKKITVIGFSFGFLVITRMLQRYPDIRKQINLTLSVVGFSGYKDFSFSKTRFAFYKYFPMIFTGRLTSRLFRYTALNSFIVSSIYGRTRNAKHKLAGLESSDRKQMLNAEVKLWHQNDLRTHMYTYCVMFRTDLTKKKIPLPLWHVQLGTKADQYFDTESVVENLRRTYKTVNVETSDYDRHMPSLFSSLEEAEGIVPESIRILLDK